MKRILTGGAVFAAIVILLTGAYLRFSALESKSPPKAQKSASTFFLASGIFIIPPGGKEINKDTAGRCYFPKNVGEIVSINTMSPINRLFFINENGTEIEIDPGLTRIRIIDLGQKPYISFVNYGREPATIRVSRH